MMRAARFLRRQQPRSAAGPNPFLRAGTSGAP